MSQPDKGIRNYNPSLAAQNTKAGKSYLDKIRKMEPYERLLYWIKERHAIHLRRFPNGAALGYNGDWAEQTMAPPYTEDPIMQTVFICNPYSRENDKISRWMLDHYLLPMKEFPSVFLGAIYMRWYNYIPTMRIMIDEKFSTDLSHPTKGVKAIQDSIKHLVNLRDNFKPPTQLFGGAYIIRPIVDGKKGARKVESIGELMIRMAQDKTLYKEIIGEHDPVIFPEARKLITLGSTTTDAKPGSMAYAFARLQTFSGMGKFYCYQFIGDLAYTHVLRNAPDWWDWGFVGPGTARGLYRLRCPSGQAKLPNGDRLPRMMKYDRDMAQQLLDLRVQVNKDLGLHPMSKKQKEAAMSGNEVRKMVPIHMRNLTGCLCEYDKYERSLYNERSIKRPFRGQGSS